MADVQGDDGIARYGRNDMCRCELASNCLHGPWRSLRAMVAVACMVCAVAPQIL